MVVFFVELMKVIKGVLTIENLYSLILKNGIMKYKYKNSKENKTLDLEEVKGSIFIFRSKEMMTYSKGIVLTSLEALKENKKYITHWTPNVYKYGTYKDEERNIAVGHSERNLRQINTFYLDFDSEKITECDILSVSLELGFLPTTILKTTRGYQVYYVLKSPVYITKNTDFKAIEVAKKVSNNLRKYFESEKLPVDKLCNHFGIARFPTKENIVYFDENNIYSFSDLLDWSIKQDDSIGKEDKNKQLYILSGSKKYKQIDEKWFNLLLNSSDVQGKKDLLGRNNVLFTLALACFSSGLTQLECEEKLRIFNENLENTLKEKEYQTIINSAYSSKYVGASKEYIISLCKLWIDKDIKTKDLFIYQKWTKFKKERKERKRSFLSEWEVDILNYLAKKQEIYLTIKKKDIVDELNIPKRSLDNVLSTLKNKGVIFYKAKSGRLGGIKIALTKKIYFHTISLIKEAKEKFIKTLASYFKESEFKITKTLITYQDNNYIVKTTLFEEDVGEILIV